MCGEVTELGRSYSPPKLARFFEPQCSRCLGECNGMLSQSHLPHCRVLPYLANSLSWFQSYMPHCRVLLHGEFNDMSSQSHMSRCRVGLLPLSEFSVMIPEPHATLQGAVTWQNQCYDRAILQDVRIPCAILKIVFRHILFFCFLNAVWALTIHLLCANKLSNLSIAYAWIMMDKFDRMLQILLLTHHRSHSHTPGMIQCSKVHCIQCKMKSRHSQRSLHIGWLVFNDTDQLWLMKRIWEEEWHFQHKKAISCHAKIKSLLKILISDWKLKYVV